MFDNFLFAKWKTNILIFFFHFLNHFVFPPVVEVERWHRSFTDLLHCFTFDCFILWSRLFEGKKKKELFRNFCHGDLPGTSLLRNTLIRIHLRSLAHRICGFFFFLFGNIAFILFLWRLYVLDESGMRKDLCLFTKSFALWWMTQPAFSKCIISCPLFHDPFGILSVPAPEQWGILGGCIPSVIKFVWVI